jgi:ectoine hydroxylase-related dioxygenase (phytanoyl-CoA dioxygenase family)
MEHQHREDFQVDEDRLDLSREVSVPLASGGALVFHSLLLHATAPNESDRPRRAMITSYMSARSRFVGASKPEFMTIAGRSFEGCV